MRNLLLPAVLSSLAVLAPFVLSGGCTPSVTVIDGSGGTGSSTVDADGDGYDATVDCDDADATIHPGQEEPCTCDLVDQNCNGIVDDFPCDLACVDQDQDGYPAGIDCNDDDPTVHPDQEEPCVCDGIDQDCNGIVDDFPCFLACLDEDQDGYPEGIDCDDLDPTVHPDQDEPCVCDAIDQNCNGVVDDLPCPMVCAYLTEGSPCTPGQTPACGEGLSCCYPCGIAGCQDTCTPTCTGPGCVDGCAQLP